MEDQPPREARKGDGALLMVALALGLPLALYSLVLIERKYPVLLAKGAFLQTPLAAWEKAVFLIVVPVQIIFLLLTATVLLRPVVNVLTGRRYRTRFTGILVAAAYFASVTIQFDVYRYFRDGIDLAQARDLGGGLGGALRFVAEELVGLLPVVVAGFIAAVVGALLLRRYGKAMTAALGRTRLAAAVSSTRGLVLLNVVLVLLPAPILALSAPLDRTLRRCVAYRAYRLPAVYGTDFDFDGYGLIERPIDHAPFDGDRGPYTKDVPGNGVDENGIGGDLPEAVWRDPMGAWDETKLRRRHVLLVVLETARYDLLEAEVDGAPVMPRLRNVPGETGIVIAHVGFTQAGLCAIFNGTLAAHERGISLIDRFAGMGYGTAVFSGQPQDFADIARVTGMERADVRWDASRFPPGKRMYTPTNLTSLMMPADVVVDAFRDWIGGYDPGRPFFAYLNLQDMHFPYNSSTIPKTIVDRPIPRAEIRSANREWLRRTYHNAARNVDTQLGRVFEILHERGVYEDTLIVVVGDHGEELFDWGIIGHGVDLNFEQSATLLKVIHGTPFETPLGLNDIVRVIHNSIVKDPADAVPVGGPVLAVIGNPVSPHQIGLFTADRLRKYDFIRGVWTLQPGPGAAPRAMEPDVAVVHAWESHVVRRRPR